MRYSVCDIAVKMDDEDFVDLLAGIDDFPGSSQDSLTNAAANLDVDGAVSQGTSSTGQKAIGKSPSRSPVHHNAHHPTHPALSVAEKIECIFREVADASIRSDGKLFITLSTRPSAVGVPGRCRRICFPGKTADEAWRFTVVMRIMELIHEALCNDVVWSKRDVYYRDPALFGKQAVVDRYVDSIAYTFNVPRAMLHITAAAKGLMAGAFNICRRDGSIVDATSERNGMLVPLLKDVLSVNMSAVQWILVVEKEASFRSIASSCFWDPVASQGVILTGKGYPDIATRALLHFLSTPSPHNGFASPPIFCLVDFDPDGLAIMSTYKNGSAALAHENENLRVPQLQWLGLRNSYLAGDDGSLHSKQGLLALAARDRRKAISMLDRNPSIENDTHELEVKSALQTMLMLNVKAELQLLDATPRGMENLLTSALLKQFD